MMSNPHIKLSNVILTYEDRIIKRQWCVVPTDEKYLYLQSGVNWNAIFFGFGNTIQEAWDHYLSEKIEWDKALEKYND